MRLPRIDNGPLAKCTFEETCDVLLEAAAYGEVDNVLGVSECVAVGKRARIGTGACEVISSLPPPQFSAEEGEGCDDDDVVFTSVDADMERQSSRPDSRPVEMPFSDNTSMPSIGSMSLLPSSVQHSFLHMAPQCSSRGGYVPSSPRQALHESRKRRYVPSSPRARNQRQCVAALPARTSGDSS